MRLLPALLAAAAIAGNSPPGIARDSAADPSAAAESADSTDSTELPKSDAGGDSLWIVDDWKDWKQQETYEMGKVEIKPEIAEPQPPADTKREPLPPAAAKAGVLVLGKGGPFTAVRYTGSHTIPVDEYEISWDGMRLEGYDFFAALTFPVGDLKTCASVVAGAWGGRTTGVSSISHLFASENETTRGIDFTQGRWYRFTLQVNTKCLRLLIDGRETFKVNIEDRPITMHPSEIQQCMPLGFSSFETTGAVRNVRIRKLRPGELKPDEYPN